MAELVGREKELARLQELAREAARGTGRLLFVTGDAGSGKTSLVLAALEKGPLDVVHVGANPSATSAMEPVAAALRAVRQDSAGVIEAAAARAPALKRLLPELGEAPAAPDRSALFDAAAAAFAAIAAVRPLALVLDDLQWADHATLELLPAFADAARAAALLVVGVYSADIQAGAPSMHRVRDALRRSHKLVEIVLRPLDEARVRELAERCTGVPVDAPTARRLLAESGGVPFFVECLAQATFGPAMQAIARERLRDAIAARLDALTPEGRAAAETAAVVGTQLELRLLAGLGVEDAGVEALLGAGLLVELGHGMAAFRPSLVREVLYGLIPWTRRRKLHQSIAEALESEGRHDGLAAQHWAACGERLRARAAWLREAERARRLHAHRDAMSALEQALEGWPAGEQDAARLAALDGLGEAAQLIGSAPQALKAWREVIECRAPNPLAAAHALRKIANLHELQCDWTRALAARQDAQAAFAAAGEHAEAAVEGLTAANRLRQLGRSGAALEVLVRAATDSAQAGRRDLDVRVAALQANLRVRLGDVSQGVPALRAALDAALALEQPLLAGEIYQRLADAIERSGDYRRATQVNMQGIEFCEQRKAAPGALACLACMSWILIRSGEWEKAAVASRRMARDFGANPVGRAVGLGHVGMVHALRGELRKAEPCLIEADVMARRMGHVLLEVTCSWGLALIEAGRGDDSAAAERCRMLLTKVHAHDERHAAMPPLRWAASCFARANDREGLAACAALLSESAARFSGAEPLSGLAHAMGELALLDGEPRRAREQFEHAIGLLEPLELPRERVESELRAAAACEALGEREQAVSHAREAARRAERLGARLLEQAAAAQLRRLGEPLGGALGPRAGRRNQRAGLTARQLEILVAISRGQTDKEVARTLDLSPRTVESHVAQALATLDCRSRSEAVRKASELGLLPRP